jgi:hypothetical protein
MEPMGLPVATQFLIQLLAMLQPMAGVLEKTMTMVLEEEAA